MNYFEIVVFITVFERSEMIVFYSKYSIVSSERDLISSEFDRNLAPIIVNYHDLKVMASCPDLHWRKLK